MTLQAPRLKILPTHSQPLSAGLLFLVSAGLLSCPATTADPVRILSVTVVGDSASTAFELEVEGRGFGLSAINYDVAAGTGTSSTVDLGLRISRQNGANARVFRGGAVTVQSPRLLKAVLRLDQSLVPGIYRLELLQGQDTLAENNAAFEVLSDQPADAGVDAGPTPDTGMIPDADIGEGLPDAGPADTGPDGGATDTGVDAGPPDTGIPDSGLGPFVGNYAFRRSVNVGSTVEVPAGATLAIPVTHASFVAQTKSETDGRDLRVYQGSTPLDFQWADRFALDSDTLEIVVRVARPIPAGGNAADPLALYYGDPAATNLPGDGVFEFVERFEAPVAPIRPDDANAWFKATAWDHCNAAHGTDAPLTNGDNQAYCAFDRYGDLARSSLATPRQLLVRNTPGANLIYEMNIWFAGQTPDTNQDLLYFSYGADNSTFDQTLEVPPTSWQGFRPNAQLTFTDVDNQPRTVNGWNFTPNAIQWWQRALLRFVPTVDQPSLHFRYISTATSQNSPAGVTAIDDWWIRVAVEPAPSITLGPEELMQ